MSHESAPILIGVDGGGSACRVAVCAGAQRIEAQGGPANVSAEFDRAIAAIRDAIDAAQAQAGLSVADLGRARVHLGLAGVMNDAVAARVAAALPFERIAVTDDRPTALAGALGAEGGAIAAIGTGSFLARQSGRQAVLAGGYGFAIGDQASGAWLGRRLLQQVMLCVDGFEAWTDLGRETLAEHGDDPSAVVAFSVTARPKDFARLAPRIAASDDPTALALMREGADYIAQGIRVMGWREGEALCLMGGLGPSYARHLAPGMQAALVPPKGTSLDGAVALAARIGASRIGAGP